MTQRFSWELFQRLPVVGILRGVENRHLASLVEAAIAGGLTNLEITMNTPGAADQIGEAVMLSGSRLNIGAGTVLGHTQFEAALAAGATFIVTPIVEPRVIELSCQAGVPIFPGALSATEVVRAWELGAAMVKVFPAEAFGPAYIKSLKAPLPQIKLLPTGGVDLNTLGDYVKAGADGLGVGSPLFNRDRIAAQDWPWIQKQCQAYRQEYQKAQYKGQAAISGEFLELT